MRILTIDDDTELQSNLFHVLKKEGFIVDQATTAQSGYYLASTSKFDVIVLDINLPDGNGLELCRIFRQSEIDAPVLFLSVNIDLEHKVQGLTIGADDYLTKPFSVEELVARVHCLTRRLTGSSSQAYSTGSLKLDPVNHLVYRNSKPIRLTKMESEVLRLLLKFRNRPVTREDIWDNIYGDEYPLNNSIDVIVGRLRRKLSAEDSSLIETIRGVGFRLNSDN